MSVANFILRRGGLGRAAGRRSDGIFLDSRAEVHLESINQEKGKRRGGGEEGGSQVRRMRLMDDEHQ